ncbi:hypothetical protein C9374_008965 [Naegleria lovaniensis]|uniref:USP domain-containing protein n=1 Tax=Naegleria lovaniensis TaxID=51637 RepID=A0AA88GIU5_NAELO|nr:uncharacterized protein C9374_008965 [Naegleria lovaniensis]KAG2377880.1 hypothetical protein C9374_008965 [Naegleria lovaniensis]
MNPQHSLPPLPSKPTTTTQQIVKQPQQQIRPITPVVVIPQYNTSTTPITDYSGSTLHWNGSGDHHAAGNNPMLVMNDNYGNNWQQQPVLIYQQPPSDSIYGGESNNCNTSGYMYNANSIPQQNYVTTNKGPQNAFNKNIYMNSLNNGQQLHVPIDQHTAPKRNSPHPLDSNKTSNPTTSSSPSVLDQYSSATNNNYQQSLTTSHNNSHYSSPMSQSSHDTQPFLQSNITTNNNLPTGLNSTINNNFQTVDLSQGHNNIASQNKPTKLPVPSSKKPVYTDNPINKIANVVEDFIDKIVPGDKGTRVDLTEPKPVKGLSNNIGEYNCFLNVVIQSLWNARPFRDLFLSIDKDSHFHKDPQSCVFCALKTLFTSYETDARSVIEPNDVRTSLSFAHNKDSKFQLRRMDDASEAFQAILEDVNNSLKYDQIPIFDFNVTDFYVCRNCNSYSEPHNYTTNNWCISSSEFVTNKRRDPNMSFEQAIRSSVESFHKTCENCKGTSDSQKHIFQTFPAVCTISFSWEADVISEDSILEFMSYFKIKNINLHDIFRLYCNGNDIEVIGNVSSIICYYGRHYICIVYDKKTNKWFGIDDSRVREIPEVELAHFIISSKFQPCVVLIEVEKSKGNIEIERTVKQKASVAEIELISPLKKKTSVSNLSSIQTNSGEIQPSTSNFIVENHQIGLIIDGYGPVSDFFVWRQTTNNSNIYTRTATISKDHMNSVSGSNQLNICLFLDQIELEEKEAVTVKICFAPTGGTRTFKWLDIGKLDKNKRSLFSSIPVGFIMTDGGLSKSYDLYFTLKKEKTH